MERSDQKSNYPFPLDLLLQDDDVVVWLQPEVRPSAPVIFLVIPDFDAGIRAIRYGGAAPRQSLGSTEVKQPLAGRVFLARDEMPETLFVWRADDAAVPPDRQCNQPARHVVEVCLK